MGCTAMLNLLYVYALWHLDARGLVTTGQKVGAVAALLSLSLAGVIIF